MEYVYIEAGEKRLEEMDGGDSFNLGSEIWGKRKEKRKRKKKRHPLHSYGRICTVVLNCLIIKKLDLKL